MTADKKYLLFAGTTYYPLGGFDDYIKQFDRIEDAKAFVEADKGDDYQWAQIVDRETLEIILYGEALDAFMSEYAGYEWTDR